jgi:outer membrane immunogenic protein
MKKILYITMALWAAPAMAEETTADDIGGLRVEAHVGIERPNLNTTEAGVTYVASLGSSLVYGGEIGYDVPVSSSITVGPYVGIDASSSDICEGYSAGPGRNGEVCFKSKTNIAAGLRAGFNISKSTELYLGVGYASYSLDFSDVVRNSTTNAVVESYVNNDARGGIDVTMGANFDVAKNVYLGAGFKISELGDFEGTEINLQRFQGHVAVGLRF